MQYSPYSTGKCPHCQVVVRFEAPEWRNCVGVQGQKQRVYLTDPSIEAGSEALGLYASMCPNCHRPILMLETRQTVYRRREGITRRTERTKTLPAWPLAAARPVPPEVPDGIAGDYSEAALILGLSPKASAALSRRCLQAVLREAGGATEENLANQIDEVLPKLPSQIAQNVDAIRNIGNFAAHPLKSQQTGLIVDVKPLEAEWTLNVLEELFDFYYVQPAKQKQQREALDAKLQRFGKRPMKSQTGP